MHNEFNQNELGMQPAVAVAELPEIIITAEVDNDTPADTVTTLGVEAVEQVILSADSDDQQSSSEQVSTSEHMAIVPDSDEAPEQPADSIKKPPTPPGPPTALGSSDGGDYHEPQGEANKIVPAAEESLETSGIEILGVDEAGGDKVHPGGTLGQATGRELTEEAGVSENKLDLPNASTTLHQHFDEEQTRATTIEGSDADTAQGVAVDEVTAGYAHRMNIPIDRKDWSTAWSDYDPPSLTTEWVRTTGVELGVSDPETPTDVDFSARPSFLGDYAVDEHGRPQNPTGRQGLADRGDLAKWGPNNAADPVVIATDPETNNRNILLIRRQDTGAWALPGGMVDPGEHVSQTAVRELGEETAVDLRGVQGEVVYEGYVNDPRNTDNAWVETSARLFRLAYAPEARAGDDAADARWFGCNTLDELRAEIRQLDALGETVEPLYASHSQIIEEALRRF